MSHPSLCRHHSHGVQGPMPDPPTYLEEDEDEEELVDHTDAEPEPPVGCRTKYKRSVPPQTGARASDSARGPALDTHGSGHGQPSSDMRHWQEAHEGALGPRLRDCPLCALHQSKGTRMCALGRHFRAARDTKASLVSRTADSEAVAVVSFGFWFSGSLPWYSGDRVARGTDPGLPHAKLCLAHGAGCCHCLGF